MSFLNDLTVNIFENKRFCRCPSDKSHYAVILNSDNYFAHRCCREGPCSRREY